MAIRTLRDRRAGAFAPPTRLPLPAVHQQRLDGWIAMLDIDLPLAQRTLRLPPARLPLPPIALPAVRDPYTGAVLAEAIPAPPDVATEAEAAATANTPSPRLKGAYARRARTT